MELWLSLGSVALPAIATAGRDIRRRTQARTERRATDSYLGTLMADVSSLPFLRSRIPATTYGIPATRRFVSTRT